MSHDTQGDSFAHFRDTLEQSSGLRLQRGAVFQPRLDRVQLGSRNASQGVGYASAGRHGAVLNGADDALRYCLRSAPRGGLRQNLGVIQKTRLGGGAAGVAVTLRAVTYQNVADGVVPCQAVAGIDSVRRLSVAAVGTGARAEPKYTQDNKRAQDPDRLGVQSVHGRVRYQVRQCPRKVLISDCR